MRCETAPTEAPLDETPSSVHCETAPTEVPLDETPLVLQSTSRSQCLSRQPTEPTIDILSLLSLSLSSVSSSTMDIRDQRLNRRQRGHSRWSIQQQVNYRRTRIFDVHVLHSCRSYDTIIPCNIQSSKPIKMRTTKK